HWKLVNQHVTHLAETETQDLQIRNSSRPSLRTMCDSSERQLRYNQQNRPTSGLGISRSQGIPDRLPSESDQPALRPGSSWRSIFPRPPELQSCQFDELF